MNKIRKGDQVIVIAGRDKGKRGAVAQRKCDSYLVVEGVNVVKKHVKPNPMAGVEGGIVEKNMPIHQSNVAKTLEDGKRVRVYKSSGTEIKVA